jgi:carboxyl-terminal processing protease
LSLNVDGIERRPLLLSLILVLGLIGGIALDRLAAASLYRIIGPADFRLISEAARIIQNSYVDQAAAQPQRITYGAISGMVDALGDTGHSRFLSPAMVKELKILQKNKFEGVGAEIQMKAGHVVIVAPMDNSPAQRAGLQAGDIILKVDGSDVTGLPLDQVVARVSGPAGTKVTLTILNPLSGQTRDVPLIRASITIHDVTWQQLPGTDEVHLRISSFGSGMTADLRRALTEIHRRGLDKGILDLRNNPGGLLEEAVGASSQFLKHGNVVLVKDARGAIKPIPVKAGGTATDMVLVVLINGGTASAAEITAGALSAAHRAKLIGETTIGTGTVLKEFSLSDGSALLLAVEEWLTPSGQGFWHKGITPDIIVNLPAGVPPEFPNEEQNLTPAQLRTSKDAQLLHAIQVLSTSADQNKKGAM